MYLLDLKTNALVEAEIVDAEFKDLPLRKDGWNFNWRTVFKEKNTSTYILRLKSNPDAVQCVLQLKIEGGLLIMNLVEIAPHNIGGVNKRYDYSAGCLIAFACRESFKLENSYKGFLAFESKTMLIDWYMEKYRAKIAMGQKMFTEPIDGQILIREYLNRKR
jgi:hypothetical protein